MARTLIGELLLRVKADTKEAQTVSNALRQIEQDSKRLNATPWGLGMQRQLDKLKATPRELDLVRRSWDNLISGFQSRNLNAAMRKNDISVWRQSTVSHLTAVRAEWKRLGDGQESAMRRFREAARFGAGTLGVYGATHAAARGGREALTAASRERVQQAEMKYAGLSESERGKIDMSADKYVSKYNLNKAEVLEVLKDSSLNAIDTDTALSMADPMMRAMLVLKNLFGKEGAVDGLRAFNKAMDNRGVQEPQRYEKMLDSYLRMQQIIGKDIDPEAFAQMQKYGRAPGKAYGDNFMSLWGPLMAAETGGSDAGSKMRAAFDNLASGKSAKYALDLQDELGLRQGVVRNSKGKIVESGTLTEADRFFANPLEWMHGVVMPALKKKGIDTDNPGEVAAYVGKIMSNRLGGDMLAAALQQFDQYQRQVEKRGPNAYGLKAADTIQAENPFAAFDAFKDAMSNLSAAVMPMDTISSGLNTMASVINNFQQSLRDGNPVAWGGLALGGTVAVGGPVAMLVKAGWDLITAGTALKGSAAALDAAAARLGASGGGIPGNPETKTPAGGNGAWSAITAALGKAATVGAGLTTATSLLSHSPGDTFEEQVSIQANRKDGLKRDLNRYFGWAADRDFWLGDSSTSLRDKLSIDTGGTFASNRESSGNSIAPHVDGEQAVEQARSTAEDIQNALNVTVGPTVDLAGLSALQAKLQACVATLQQLAVGIPSTVADLNSQLNRSFADHQITP
ncbi:hypothetical protein OIV19_03390 [Brucella sp. HL-2]|nr:hypothetical protein [Brucella sp. HL-2]MCV9906659.1 hypothetical protein [Brucella sp. HL-2]